MFGRLPPGGGDEAGAAGKGENAAPGALRRKVLGTGMPGWLLLALIALGLPRTVLSDLGVVAPESSSVYYVLALAPFAVWLAIALFRRTGSPVKDHLVAGALYGLSLLVVHEALWSAGSSVGHHPAQGAVTLAERFDSPFREMVLHGYACVIAMTIGLGVGVVAGLLAAGAGRVRTMRAR